MKILIFSLGPIFKDSVHGGSQKILREIMTHLGNKGHIVDVFCTKRKDNNETFSLSKNVYVHPALRFRETFPEPYKTPPYNLSSIISVLSEEIKRHDVFYIHDSGLDFTFLTKNIPTVWSLRDFIYPESILGGLNFSRDAMIINSEYTYLSYLSLIRTYRKNPEQKIFLINNGINVNHFKHKNSDSLRKRIGLPKDDLVIIYPHRPEVSKGIFEVLKVLDILVNEKGIQNIKLLIPRYIDLKISNSLEKVYKNIRDEARKLNVSNNIIFHEWIEYNDLPEYYSLGDLSLSIGNFVECFPNVSLESIACGTPSISARVATHRYVLPENIETKIDFGDIKECANIAFKYLNSDNGELIKKGKEYIIKHFAFSKMLEGYEDIITGCSKSEGLKQINISQNSRSYKIAPWCYLSEKFGFYNDYNYEYNKDEEFINLIKTKKIIKEDDNNRNIIIEHFEKGDLVLI